MLIKFCSLLPLTGEIMHCTQSQLYCTAVKGNLHPEMHCVYTEIFVMYLMIVVLICCQFATINLS